MVNSINWLLVVTVAILAIGAILGMTHGLIKTVFELVIGVVTLVLVMILTPKVTVFLQEQTGLQENLCEKVESVLWEKYEEQDFTLSTDTLDQYVDGLPFFPSIKKAILQNETVQSSIQNGVSQSIHAMGEMVAGKMVALIGYAVTYLCIFLILRILASLLNILERLPIIHGVNKLGGLIVGLAEGLFAVWILGIVFTVFGMTELGQSAAACIQESTILSILYGHNLLQQIVFWIV